MNQPIPQYIRNAIISCVARLPEKYREFAAELLAQRFLSRGKADDLDMLFDVPGGSGERIRVNWVVRELRDGQPLPLSYWLCSVEIISHVSRESQSCL